MADEAGERTADRYVRVRAIVIEDHRRLGHATFRVYWCLRSFANAEGVCWPSVSTIGKRLGMARSTISEHLATLVRCCYLRSEATSRGDKGRAANRYYFAPLPAQQTRGMSDQQTRGMSDQPTTAPFGSSDGLCRISTDTPVGTADTELDHKNITIELSPSTAREGGSVDGIIPWEHIEDLLRRPRSASMWSGLADFAEMAARSYRRDVWETQPIRVEVWLEKDALSGIFEDVLDQHGVTLNVGRGFDGRDSIHNAARRLGNGDVILYFGDCDPSGEDMVRSLRERLDDQGARPEIVKCALTIGDIEAYGLPADFTKASDTPQRCLRREMG
jgi:Helix-turn-helix domain